MIAYSVWSFLKFLINFTNVEIVSFLHFVFSFSLVKSASVTLQRAATSLPTLASPDDPIGHSENDPSIDSRPFGELAKEKSDPDKISEKQLSSEDNRTVIPLEPSVFVSFKVEKFYLCVACFFTHHFTHFLSHFAYYVYYFCFISTHLSFTRLTSLVYPLTSFSFISSFY